MARTVIIKKYLPLNNEVMMYRQNLFATKQ